MGLCRLGMRRLSGLGGSLAAFLRSKAYIGYGILCLVAPGILLGKPAGLSRVSQTEVRPIPLVYAINRTGQ